MNTEEDSLIIFERAAMMLAEADTVQKCKAGKDLCATAERYAKAQKLSEESIRHARSYALEFERKLGEMLKEKPNPASERGGPGRGKKALEPDSNAFSTPTLKELGVTYDESKTAQAVADLPDESFQAVKAGTISKKAAIKQNKMAGSSGNGDRPKSTKKPRKAPKRDDRTDEVMPLSDQGLTLDEIASQTGVPARQVRHIIDEENIRRAAKTEEPEIDLASLSMSMQQKCEAWKRQTEKRLRIEIAEEERIKVRKWWEEDNLPHYSKELANARAIEKSRKGVFTNADYRRLLAALHPDRSVSSETLHGLFILFKSKEMLLLSEKEHPVVSNWDLPKTYEDWMKRKAEVTAARKAKRDANKNK